MTFEHDLTSFSSDSQNFDLNVDEKLLVRYLKGVYSNNKPRFVDRFINPFREQFIAYNKPKLCGILDMLEMVWDHVEPFSYKEAFALDNETFRATVFSSIDIREMIEELGAKRVATEGRELINKTWNEVTEEFEEVPYHVIYELWHVDGAKLELEGEVFPVIKCWDTSSNESVFLWADNESFKDNSPLEAIASLCVLYKPMIGKIKHIIRHGDVFLFEMTEEVKVTDDDELVTLPMEEYFRLLKSQA